MTNMTISVVIPCYNCEITIQKTLESIFAQTHSDFEVIAVDDGSQDATGEILKRYNRKIQYIYQDNAGVSKARNTGVKHAKGEWIAFCDSDDLWHPGKLEVIDYVLKQNQDCHVIFSDYCLLNGEKMIVDRGMQSKQSVFPIFREGNVRLRDIFENYRRDQIKNPILEWKYCDIYSGNIFKWLIVGNFILPSAVVIRTEAYRRAHGFNNEFRVAEDTEFFLRLAKDHNYLYVDLPLIGYRRTETSLVSTCMEKTMLNGIKALEVHGKNDLATYRKHKNLVDKSLAKKYARISCYYLSELRKKEGFASGVKALRYNKVEALAWLSIIGSFIPRRILFWVRKIKGIIRHTLKGLDSES